MAFWTCCPECDATNYFEENDKQIFDCGFEGADDDDVRVSRCAALDMDEASGVGPVVDEGSKYRLGFLDAAHVADGIARDIDQSIVLEGLAQRCRDLAEQMRSFAGHGLSHVATSFDDLSGQATPPQGGFRATVKKLTSW
jgi:hypothetical protein